MEVLAIISHLLHYVLAILAIYFCVTLFRQSCLRGWLLVIAVFLEPFVLLLMRAIRGRPWMPYKTSEAGLDGVSHVTYRVDFPFLYIIAVVGLFMLVRQSQKKRES